MTSHPKPAWASFAATVLRRLDETWHIHSCDFSRNSVLDVPTVLPGVAPSALPKKSRPDRFEPAPDDPFDLPVPLHVTQLCLQLSSTFGTQERFAQCFAPGAVTVVTGIPSDQMTTVRELLSVGFAPEAMRIGFQPRDAGNCDALLLSLEDIRRIAWRCE